jgi:UDPglucose 6-dehydrogenase
MKIGIIGLGVVGTANCLGFKQLGHVVSYHDINLGTTIDDVVDTDIVFVCVPSPENSDSSCDTSIVQDVLHELNNKMYTGIVAIRSTVEPGFTQSMIDFYPNLILCFTPEFLRERCALDDFTNNCQLLAVGTNDTWVYNKVVEAHGSYPKKSKQLKPAEAEILKYYSNVFAALKVTFANIMFELSESLNCDYSVIKESFVSTGKADDSYLDANYNLRGYGGVCLPKDTRALAELLERVGLDFELIRAIDNDNSKYITTVFNGMRDGKLDTE